MDSRSVESHLGAARLAFFTPIRDQPPLADRKASVLLAANGLMVTVLFTFSKSIEAILSGPNRWTAVLITLVLSVLGILILVGAWCSFLALTRPIPPMPDAPVLYSSIAARPLEGYRDLVKSLDQTRAVEAILHYNYSLATLCVTKFRLVNRSMRCARATFELWMVLLIMITALH